MSRSARQAGPLGRLFAWLGGAFFATSLLYFLYAYFVRFSGMAPAGADALAPLAVDTALFTAFALHHSVLARLGAKRVVERVVTPALERSVYVWGSSALFLACCHWWQELPGVVYRLPGMLHPLGWLMQAVGLWVILRAARTLDALDLAGIRQAAGHHTATALQTDGVYGRVRHPLYLGWALLTFGAPDMTATRFWFASISTFYLIVAIPIEERSLVREFGDAYRAYRRQVRWRMLPWIY
jgi:protein-S-isoprenylcysteine O-methyltransferase Ste14